MSLSSSRDPSLSKPTSAIAVLLQRRVPVLPRKGVHAGHLRSSRFHGKLTGLHAVGQNEWRKFVSPTCPGPRSAHAVVASPAGGGKLYLFGTSDPTCSPMPYSAHLFSPGGEFSSLYQNSFHHYRDFWCFDIATHSWDRIETKVRPTARSGHRYVPSQADSEKRPGA